MAFKSIPAAGAAHDADLEQGCPSLPWLSWLRQYVQISNIWAGSSPAHHNCGPHPAALERLTNTSLPLFAVVHDGPAWLVPPHNMVWYRASLDYLPVNLSFPWWTSKLPVSGGGMRCLEWLPFAPRDLLLSKVKWWLEALDNDPLSVLVLVTDPTVWGPDKELSALSPWVRAYEVNFISTWGVRHDAPWDIVHKGGTLSRITLLARAASGASTNCSPLGGEEEAKLCITQIANALSSTQPGTELRWNTAAGALTPAHWWWGPTLNTPIPAHKEVLRLWSEKSYSVTRCACEFDIGVCGLSMSSQLANRYLGNIGVPPACVSDGSGDVGAKDPPQWRSHAWHVLAKFCSDFNVRVTPF